MENKEKKCLECGTSIPNGSLNYCQKCIDELLRFPPPAEMQKMYEELMNHINAKIAEYKSREKKARDQ